MKHGVLLLLLLTACGTIGRPAYGPIDWPDHATVAPQFGQRAPNWRLEATTGPALQLDQLRGHPVIVNFFATWCRSCREEMPLLQRATVAATVVGIDLRDDPDAVAAFAQRFGASYPLLLDRTGTVNEHYHVSNLPMTFFLDRDGVVRDVVLGAVTDARLQGALSRMGAATTGH